MDGTRNADLGQPAIASDELGAGDFGKVVIFSSDPEDGDGGGTALRQTRSKLDRRQSSGRLCERPGEKSRLLTRNNRYRG